MIRGADERRLPVQGARLQRMVGRQCVPARARGADCLQPIRRKQEAEQGCDVLSLSCLGPETHANDCTQHSGHVGLQYFSQLTDLGAGKPASAPAPRNEAEPSAAALRSSTGDSSATAARADRIVAVTAVLPSGLGAERMRQLRIRRIIEAMRALEMAQQPRDPMHPLAVGASNWAAQGEVSGTKPSKQPRRLWQP